MSPSLKNSRAPAHLPRPLRPPGSGAHTPLCVFRVCSLTPSKWERLVYKESLYLFQNHNQTWPHPLTLTLPFF